MDENEKEPRLQGSSDANPTSDLSYPSLGGIIQGLIGIGASRRGITPGAKKFGFINDLGGCCRQ